MRKAMKETEGTRPLTTDALDQLQRQGYRYVQIKGMTLDRHYDYIEPQLMVLVPMRELSADPLKRDIYEPINSELLYRWAGEPQEHTQMLIARAS